MANRAQSDKKRRIGQQGAKATPFVVDCKTVFGAALGAFLADQPFRRQFFVEPLPLGEIEFVDHCGLIAQHQKHSSSPLPSGRLQKCPSGLQH